MAERVSKQRMKRKSEEEVIAIRKESKKKYEASSHIIRIALSTFERWTSAKKSLNVKTNDEMATTLLDLWESTSTSTVEKTDLETDREETPSKGNHLHEHSTPLGHEKKQAPLPVFAGISDISESNGQSSRASSPSSLKKYIDKAKQTEGSFLDIKLEMVPNEKDINYHPTVSEEEEAYSDESDMDETDEI